MALGVRIVLLILALVAYAAGGAALAVVRSRSFAEGRRDLGMTSVAGSLIVVGALCTTAGGGLMGILAFGGVTVWASYIATAQRLGVFQVQTGIPQEPALEEHRRR
jgi:hypothetical protein